MLVVGFFGFFEVFFRRVKMGGKVVLFVFFEFVWGFLRVFEFDGYFEFGDFWGGNIER